MEIFFHKKAVKELKKLNKELRKRIIEKITRLRKNPRLGEKLKFSNFWKLRVGDYRVIYEIEDKKLLILFIGHRKKVYDDFSRLL